MPLRTYTKESKEYAFYKKLYTTQSYDVANKKARLYNRLDKNQMYMHEVLAKMDEFIDPSDPDLDQANIIHAYQTAERIRKKRPNNIQYQICGLIHDLGKILFSFGEEPQFIVGDTYVLGTKIPDSVVCYDSIPQQVLDLNESMDLYKTNCGLDNLVLSYGHDEYLYQVLMGNNTNHTFEKEYMDIIRYHSFYPWHTAGKYRNFMNREDCITLHNICDFNKYDLYSKEDTDFVLTPKIKKYYDDKLRLIFPKKLIF
jgi:inositol oxygenase